MNDPRSALDQALDLVVFAPLGLAVTIVEELPELAEKGRARLNQRTAAARLVGQLAVAEGRRRLRNAPGPASAAPRATPSRPATATRPGESAPAQEQAGVGSRARDAGARRPGGAGPGVAGPGAGTRAGATAPATNQLAIPGYDSLSASQVVQRLASLSADELEAVRTYEATNRGRRTILARVAQLQHD